MPPPLSLPISLLHSCPSFRLIRRLSCAFFFPFLPLRLVLFNLVGSRDVDLVWSGPDFLTVLASAARASMRASIHLYGGSVREQDATLFFLHFFFLSSCFLRGQKKKEKQKKNSCRRWLLMCGLLPLYFSQTRQTVSASRYGKSGLSGEAVVVWSRWGIMGRTLSQVC